MKHLYYSTIPLTHSTFIELEGSFEFSDAVNFKNSLSQYISTNKDLYIDIKQLHNIDLIGLNSLLTAKSLVEQAGGQFFIFVNNTNPIYELMDRIKFNNQLSFRNSFIQDINYNIAS